MNFKDLVISNRSCRNFDRERQVTREELIQMVDLARQSAAGANVQPMKYYLVTDPVQAAAVNDLTTLAMHIKDERIPAPGKEPPSYIVMCQDLDVNDAIGRFGPDMGINGQTITLAATEMGLAGCIVGNFDAEKIAVLLDLPDNFRVLLVIAIGKPAEERRIVEIDEGEPTVYYRENGIHVVPKRKLKNVIINC